MKLAILSLIINFAYAAGNAALGFMTLSWWFVTVSAYYVILSIMRLLLLLAYVKGERRLKNKLFIRRFSGAMFLAMSIILFGVVVLTVRQGIGEKHHEIIMIAFAAYTFARLTLAIVNLCKSKKSKSEILKILRSISFAEAAVSIFSLQRSMLVSFREMPSESIVAFNTMTGLAVCAVVFILGINLIRKNGL